MIDLDTAYRIGDRMARPWQWATAVLSLTVAGLLYIIMSSSLDVDNSVKAEEVTAKSLTTISKVLEK